MSSQHWICTPVQIQLWEVPNPFYKFSFISGNKSYKLYPNRLSKYSFNLYVSLIWYWVLEYVPLLIIISINLLSIVNTLFPCGHIKSHKFINFSSIVYSCFFIKFVKNGLSFGFGTPPAVHAISLFKYEWVRQISAYSSSYPLFF